MDSNDYAMMDRIERLAFQAGLATGTGQAVKAQPEQTLAEKRLLECLRHIAVEYPDYSGTLWASTNYKFSLNWEDIHALAKGAE